VLLPLYATLFTPYWIRSLGARLGRRCEVSTVSSITPDMLDVADECFFADGAVVGGMRIHRRFAQIGKNKIGSRTFIGNSAILPTGVSMPKESLLGCLSVIPANSPPLKAKSKWLGSPPFALPNLQPAAEFSQEQIYQPSRRMILARAMVDTLRILIPGLIAGVASLFGLFALAKAPVSDIQRFLLAPFLALGLTLGAALTVVLLKWAVMGRFKPVVQPLWSPYVWFNEMINGAYEATFAPSLGFLMGTPFVVPFLRLLGIKIGKHVYVESLLFSEFDLVEIGDGVALNSGATIQTHLFENRIMKSSHLRIGNRCSVGNMAVVLYDTRMAPGSVLSPLSLLMKGETLPCSGTWTGIPCREEGPVKEAARNGNTKTRRRQKVGSLCNETCLKSR
jgi:non-ribosomal peptide synthetase-like protein